MTFLTGFICKLLKYHNENTLPCFFKVNYKKRKICAKRKKNRVKSISWFSMHTKTVYEKMYVFCSLADLTKDKRLIE